MKAAFFCRNPLGDGVNSLVLSQSLHNGGWEVDTYHDGLGSMQNWVPHLPILPYPSMEAIPHLLQRYDQCIAVWDAKTPFIVELVKEAKRNCPDKLRVVYLYPSRNIVKEPYYSDCQVDPRLPVAENYWRFGERAFGVARCKVQWAVPQGLIFRKHAKRIVLHPTGSKPLEGNWPKRKFIELALHLKGLGYEVVAIPGARDMAAWCDAPFEQIDFPTWDGLARYVYESGYLVGSDSGPGHLASALGIPTLTVCRRKALARLWKPSLAINVTITPPSWVPNMRWVRLRDRHWQLWIPVRRVRQGFERLFAKELLSKLKD